MTAVPRAARISALVALLLAAVWLLWPSALGGGTTYVATHGVSMEPGFHTGDMAILRPAGSYSVGDVVAYRSPSLDTIVMHRIVDVDANGFVTQGDNNNWLDEDRPTQDEILGRLFVRIPRGGQALDTLRSPGAAVFVAGGLLTVLGSAYRPRARAGPHNARSSRRRTVRTPALSMSTRAVARRVALGSGAVAGAALVSGVALFVTPSTQLDTRTVQVAQQGQYSYTGAAVAGTTYPTGVIETGDTVWTKLSRHLTVTFANTVTGPELTEVRGAMRLDVSVSAADGWTAVLISGPQAALENGTGTASVTVDPSAASDLLSRHYAEIGDTGGGATLTVTPVAVTNGVAAGRSFTAMSPAAMEFALDAASLRPAGDLGETLAPTSQTDVQIEEAAPRALALLGLSVPIDVARGAVAGVLAFALVVLAAGAWIGRTRRGDVADQFLVRHADRILPVAAFTPGPTVIDVSDAESLRRVAERFDTLVLHHASEDEDVFVVRDVDATYRLVIPGPPGRRRGKPPVPGQDAAPMATEPATPAEVREPVAPVALVASEPPESTTPLPLIAAEPPDLTGPMPLVAPPSRLWADRAWDRVA